MSGYRNGEWNLYSKTESTYANNTVTTIKSYKNKDGWRLDSKTESTYYLSGNCIIEINSFYIDDKWEYGHRLENTYDSDGNLLVSVVSYYENETWAYNQKIEYTYNQRGMRTSYSIYKYLNNEWILTDIFKFINYQPISIYYLGMNNGAFESKSETVEYGSFGYPTVSIFSKYINGEWVYVEKTEKTYDENGYLKSWKEYDYIDGEWVVREF